MKRIACVSVLLLVLSGLLPSTSLARDYVVMISAGRTVADNTPLNSEYWYDMFLLYTSLIEYGYEHDDIYVLYGFGTDFASTLERYQNPYPDPITDYDNAKQTIQSVLGTLGTQMTANDQIYVWWLGHGSGGSSLTMSIENQGQTVTDVEFANYMAQITEYRLRAFSIMTCYSGGIIDNVQGPDSIVMTSASTSQTSASEDLCDAIHTEFHYHETCAFDWNTPFGLCGPIDADTDNNSMVSFLEAFTHAHAGTQASTPQLSDLGGHASSSYLTVNGTPGGIIFDSLEISDDEIGSSSGNGDGIPNPGETIELWVTVRNTGTETAQNVAGTLASLSGSATVLSAATTWNDIPAGGNGSSLTALVFEISGLAVHGESLPFALAVTHTTGSSDIALQFTVTAPDLSYYHSRLDDTAAGNGNGVLDIGEEVQVYVSLANTGGADATGVEAQLASASPYLTVVEGQAGTSSIPFDAVAELAPAYRVQVAANAPEDEVLELELAIAAGGGYQTTSGFTMKVGTHFFDDAEADGAWTLGAPGDDAETGHWVRVDPIGTEYSGQPCQSEDDHTVAPGTDCFVTGQGPPGGTAGQNDVDNGTTTLISPAFDLTNLIEPRVTYWRWYTNNLGNNPDGDWWVVQVSPDGGSSWVDLERTTDSANSWTEQSFSIEDFITPTSQVVFQFIASDLPGAGSLVEAAVDDFEISGLSESAGVASGAPSFAFRLLPAQPNPLRTGTVISFSLPAEGEVTLSLYGVDGRLVRTLTKGHVDAGVHDVAWDGADHSGRRVAQGVYFYKLVTGERELTRKLVVVR
jgi:hypothetical protein